MLVLPLDENAAFIAETMQKIEQGAAAMAAKKPQELPKNTRGFYLQTEAKRKISELEVPLSKRKNPSNS